jgi:hypothetical protein
LVNFSHSKFKCTTLCEVYKGVTLLSQRWKSWGTWLHCRLDGQKWNLLSSLRI